MKVNDPRSVLFAALTLAFVGAIFGSSLAAVSANADQPIVFSRDVAPILVENCTSCHNAKKAEGNYRIDTYAELLKPGDSGELPISKSVEAANVDGHESELLRRLITEDVGERMPEGSDPLLPAQIDIIRRWLAEGANFDGADQDLELSFVAPPKRYPEPPASYHVTLPVTAVAFSPDGGEVIVAGYHEITIWDANEGTLVRRIDNLGQRIFAIRASQDGTQLAVACGQPGKSGEVRLIDFTTGGVTAVVARSTDVALDVAFSPDGQKLAVCGADSLIHIVDLQTKQTVRTLAGHADWVTAVGWSSDSKRLVSASRDKSAKVFEAETGELLTTYSGHGAAVRGVMMSADGKHVFSSGADKQLHRWEATGGKRIAVVGLGGEGFHITGNESTLFVPSSDGRLLQIDLAKNAVDKAFVGLKDWAMAADWHRETGQVVAGSYAGEIALWSIADAVVANRWIAKP